MIRKKKPAANSVPSRIRKFNSKRIPGLLKLKYKNMRQNPFVFYRGSCHLFYEDLPSASFLNNSPLTWVCGDLHLENIGSYKADNRLVYFDINDFDESALAPCLWDVSRLMTSIMIANYTLGADKKTVLDLSKNFLNCYINTLKGGSARLIEKETATGMVRSFLENRETRKRKKFIESRTVKAGNSRKLLMDNVHISPLNKSKKEEIIQIVQKWAKNQSEPGFYKILDIGGRIAGTGSLGLERYALLVEGNGALGNYLLDLKIANPSCLEKHLEAAQPKWTNQAERIINIQKRMQAFPLALLSNIKINNDWFVLKELQPAQDKFDLRSCKGKLNKLNPVIKTMAEITAWDQLRSGGRQGSAITDELLSFAHSNSWEKDLKSYSLHYTEKVKIDFKEYAQAFDDGYFKA
jgi:uncharacterized protein (DUF2252 family)